ncbi:hypothetical protein MP638_003158 [Amoeboaphelidium occidentale]|nr:hypothetical protein MP638_003158 [Amoeboaphelidium occidentale]
MGCGGSKVAPEKGKKPGQQQSNQQPKVKASSNADDMKKGKESVTSKDQASKKSKSVAFEVSVDELKVPANQPLSANQEQPAVSGDKLMAELIAKEEAVTRNRMKELEKIQGKASERAELVKKASMKKKK